MHASAAATPHALDTHSHVLLQPRVRLVHDLIHGEGRSGPIRMLCVVCSERLCNLRKPVVELRSRPRIEGGE